MSPATGSGLRWAIALLIFSGGWVAWRSVDPSLAREHGPMENFQVVTLVLGSVLLLMAAARENRFPHRALYLGQALLFFTFFIAEFDVRPWKQPALNLIFNGRIRDAWLGAMWVGAAVLFFRQPAAIWSAFLGWVRTPAGILLLAAGVFWLAAGISDKTKVFGRDLFGEELFEVNAALLMVASAFLTRRRGFSLDSR
jgi:hypothetical protein